MLFASFVLVLAFRTVLAANLLVVLVGCCGLASCSSFLTESHATWPIRPFSFHYSASYHLFRFHTKRGNLAVADAFVLVLLYCRRPFVLLRFTHMGVSSSADVHNSCSSPSSSFYTLHRSYLQTVRCGFHSWCF